MSSFFQETCKILGIRKTHTTSYHPRSNGMIERLHRDLHAGLTHSVNSANTNWDILVPFYLMSHIELHHIPPLALAHSSCQMAEK